MPLSLLIADINSHSKDRTLTEADLKDLGYSLAGKSLSITAHTKKSKLNYTIYEVIDERGSSRSFCYLVNHKTSKGVILPYPFEKYEKISIEEEK